MSRTRPRHPQLLTEALLVKIEEFLRIGCTVEVTCAGVGISRETFYDWKRASREWCALGDAFPRMPVAVEIIPILTFLTRVTRAQAQAMAVATSAVYGGLIERRYVTQEPYTHIETRFRRNKDGEEVPYQHEETRFRDVEHVVYPEWRAGIEFLRRRDPEHWNPPARVEVTFEQKAVAYIRSGEITFEQLEQGYGHERAAALFEQAGVPIPILRHEDVMVEDAP